MDQLVEQISEMLLIEPKLDDINGVLGLAIYELHMGNSIKDMFSNDNEIDRFLQKLKARTNLTEEMSISLKNYLREMASGK